MGKLEIEATLPVHPVVREVLLPKMTAFPSVFPGRSTMHVSPGTISKWVALVGTEAGIENLAPHRLRHTAIATVNDATGDLRLAQEFARHADITTTQIYTRVRRDRLLRAIDTLNYLGAWVSICWWGDRLVDRWRCCLGVFTGVGPHVCGCVRRECGYEEQLF